MTGKSRNGKTEPYEMTKGELLRSVQKKYLMSLIFDAIKRASDLSNTRRSFFPLLSQQFCIEIGLWYPKWYAYFFPFWLICFDANM